MAIAEIAKFLAGAFAWDAILHIGLFMSKSEPKFFGMKFTNSMNKVMAVGAFLLFILFAYIGWFAGLQ